MWKRCGNICREVKFGLEEAKFIGNTTNESISTSESYPLRCCVVYHPNFSHKDVSVLCPNFTSTVFFSTLKKLKRKRKNQFKKKLL
jgi:hypothetical protein